MIAAEEGTTCLNVMDYICHRNTVVASTGDIYQAIPTTSPPFLRLTPTTRSDLGLGSFVDRLARRSNLECASRCDSSTAV